MATQEEKIKQLQDQLNKLLDNQKMHTIAVSVKLPVFWANKPEVWFGQVEAQFEIAGITQSKTKYNHVISILDTKTADEVADIIRSPPPTDHYEHLKMELISRMSVSRENKLKRLLGEEDIGDRKPSQLLRHLRSLAGTSVVGDDIIRELWMRRLPENVSAILVAQDDLPLERSASIADKIVEQATHAVHAVATSSNEIAQLSEKVEQLTKIVEALSTDRSRPRARLNSRSRFSSRSSSRSSSLCWYHQNYKSRAKKCASPCSWEENNPGKERGSQ